MRPFELLPLKIRFNIINLTVRILILIMPKIIYYNSLFSIVSKKVITFSLKPDAFAVSTTSPGVRDLRDRFQP